MPHVETLIVSGSRKIGHSCPGRKNDAPHNGLQTKEIYRHSNSKQNFGNFPQNLDLTLTCQKFEILSRQMPVAHF